MAHDAFISHSSADKLLAEKLMATLERNEIKCWAAMRDALYGPTYASQIVDAIRGSKLMVLIFSTASNESPHVIREVERAVDLRIPLITIRVQNLKPCDDLDYFLRVCHWMDAFDGDFDAHSQKLSNQVRQMINKSAATAPAARAAASEPAATVSSAPAAAPPKAAATADSPTIVTRRPVAKIAAAACIVIAIAALAMLMMPDHSAASAQTEHFLSADEVRQQITAELTAVGNFKLASAPVTRAQFAAFVHARSDFKTDAESKGLPLTWRDPGFHQSDSDPVVCISRRDAQAFCAWLGDDRLPTAAEWHEASAQMGDIGGKLWQWMGDSPDASAVLIGGSPDQAKLEMPEDASMNAAGFRVASGG